MVEKSRNFLDEKRRVSTKTINLPFGVDVATPHKIIQEDLMMHKIRAKLFPG